MLPCKGKRKVVRIKNALQDATVPHQPGTDQTV